MKRVFAAIAMSGLGVWAWAGQGQPIELKSDADRTDYSLGYQIGGELKGKAKEINPEIVVRAIQDAMSGAQPLMPAEEMRKNLAELRREMVAKALAQRQQELAKAQEEGKAFLAENAKKEGVVTLPSGLQYKVVKPGEGAKPGPKDKVTVDYRGTFVDGTEFDSSYKRGKPVTLPLHGVIQGWIEALQLMQEGAEWQLFIPAELAYGNSGQMAGRTLVFDVALKSVDKAPPVDDTAPGTGVAKPESAPKAHQSHD